MQQFNLQQANVAVIGAGTMGIGIAQLAAMNVIKHWSLTLISIQPRQHLHS